MRSKGFIGLGVMGFPMASHLQKGSHDVRVYNRSQEKSIKWAESSGGSYFLTPEEAAEGCDVVFLCVGRDEDVRLVVAGEEWFIKKFKTRFYNS